MTKDLYRYVWKISGRDQVILSALAVTLFLLELAPLELQQRIVNGAVDRQAFGVIGLLCLLYVVVALVQGGLKLIVNVYRGSVSEAASRRLRLETNLIAVARSEKRRAGRKTKASRSRSSCPRWTQSAALSAPASRNPCSAAASC
jgi:hypothetical protein